MLLGLIGKKQSGKSTIANILVKDYGFLEYAFADPIKEILKIIFKWDDARIDKKEIIDIFWGISPRQALQKIGTELFQFELGKQVALFQETIDRSIWVKCFEKWYDELPHNSNVVVSDVRFQHEINSLIQLDAQFLKIVRNDLINNDPHISENLSEEVFYDYLIENVGTMEDLVITISNEIIPFIMKKGEQ